MKEDEIEQAVLNKLADLKYRLRPDIKDRATLEANFREKFEGLNRVTLSDNEFNRLLNNIVNGDVYQAAQTLRQPNTLERDDGTPLHYTLVNIRNWCKNEFEVVNQLRINTQNSHQRYDVMLLINGIPVVQIELKKLDISPRRAIEQIIQYKNDRGNGYNHTLLCFIQLFIVSNQIHTWYFANNQARHFSFNADERFLPVYQWADIDNKKITHLNQFADTFLVKLRFPEFRETWTSSIMGSLYSFKGNNSLSREKLNYKYGLFKNIHYGDIHTKFSTHFRAHLEPVPYINTGELQPAIRSENYCIAGDMVFADASEDIKDIGKAIEIIDAGDIPLVSGLHTILARPNKGIFVLGFSVYLFSSLAIRKQIQREAQGAKVLGISSVRLRNVYLYDPIKKEEQQKIADCLSSLDELLEAQTEKINTLKTHKTALMQQLLP